MNLRECLTETDWDAARTLILELVAAIGTDLSFQNFDAEIADLRGMYGPPDGCLLLASTNDEDVGCVALRKLAAGVCEMKRMYVRPALRGHGVGRLLAEGIIERARLLGYKSMRLDTLTTMRSAQSLYRMLGFKEIAPYRYNPIAGTVFMELQLTSEA